MGESKGSTSGTKPVAMLKQAEKNCTEIANNLRHFSQKEIFIYDFHTYSVQFFKYISKDFGIELETFTNPDDGYEEILFYLYNLFQKDDFLRKNLINCYLNGLFFYYTNVRYFLDLADKYSDWSSLKIFSTDFRFFVLDDTDNGYVEKAAKFIREVIELRLRLKLNFTMFNE